MKHLFCAEQRAAQRQRDVLAQPAADSHKVRKETAREAYSYDGAKSPWHWNSCASTRPPPTIAPEVIDAYSEMVNGLVGRYCSDVTRYTTSSFLRMKLRDALQRRSVAMYIYESLEEASSHEARQPMLPRTTRAARCRLPC
ncbi:hypothetical protein [Paraburkholderia sp. BL6665CI2N2]|uniref:hypothetical protein n=1 Tax=Paraburkholderia sp. BL6665CI2N2 TaxID=1938806 RepID=UPI001AB052B9|nr:hypothetical protein [Paraburkholderia sp. BL6665CI2N2]